MSRRVLVVRLDSAGDVLLTGPAVRAVAASGAEVTMLAGPRGAEAASLLPGVREVRRWRSPWTDLQPPAATPQALHGLVSLLTELSVDAALVFTSFHQSPLPFAVLARMAGIPFVAANCDDYPGSLLDVRNRPPDDLHEAERNLSLARAAGYLLPPGDDGALAINGPLDDPRPLVGNRPYVVVHPGASAPARTLTPRRWVEVVTALTAAGYRVVVTGSAAERALCRHVAGERALDLSGRTDLRMAAAVLQAASVVVVGNTGPAHLAAAVGTPVVSLFAPTVPLVRWAPYRVPQVVLGDQGAACQATRVTTCPLAGHPCLDAVPDEEVVRAVGALAMREAAAAS